MPSTPRLPSIPRDPFGALIPHPNTYDGSDALQHTHGSPSRNGLLVKTRFSRALRSIEGRRRTDISSIHWLVYMEKQERDLIKSVAYSTSPVRCYFLPGDDEGCVIPSLCVKGPPAVTTDEDLSNMIEAALETVRKRVCGQACSGVITQSDNPCDVKAKEAPSKEFDPGRVLKEFEDGRSSMAKEYLKQIELCYDFIDLIREEKAERVVLLGQFISCCPPKPCRCLLWDMEVLEESAIELEPAVSITCLFVSIVFGERSNLELSLLRNREFELVQFKQQQLLIISALNNASEIRLIEQRRIETILDYHAFCLKILQQHQETAAAKEQPIVDESLEKPHANEAGGARFLISYYKYLRIVGVFEVEEQARARHQLRELTEFCQFLYSLESMRREEIESHEVLARRTVVEVFEAVRRRAILDEEDATLKEDVRPDEFQKDIQRLMNEMCERRRQAIESECAAHLLELLGDYERSRRIEIGLLEKRLWAQCRLVFVNVTRGASKVIAERWMVEHEMLLLERKEAVLRKTIEESEGRELAVRAIAHEWMVNHNRTLQKAAQEKEFKCAVARFSEEEAAKRRVLESTWAHEHAVLFEEALCVPRGDVSTLSMRTSGNDNDDCGNLSILEIRRTIVSNLSNFFDDRLLMAIFDKHGTTAAETSQ